MKKTVKANQMPRGRSMIWSPDAYKGKKQRKKRDIDTEYSEISASMGADHLPWSQDGSDMQPLSAMQYRSDASVAEYPIFADMNGELVLHILSVQPEFLVADIDGDGTSELILCVNGVDSAMSWCKLCSFRSGSLEETLHLTLN